MHLNTRLNEKANIETERKAIILLSSNVQTSQIVFSHFSDFSRNDQLNTGIII